MEFQSTNRCQLGSMVCKQTGLVDGLTQRNCLLGSDMSVMRTKRGLMRVKNARSDRINTQQFRQSRNWFHCPCVSVRTRLLLSRMTTFSPTEYVLSFNRHWSVCRPVCSLVLLCRCLQDGGAVMYFVWSSWVDLLTVVRLGSTIEVNMWIWIFAHRQ